MKVAVLGGGTVGSIAALAASAALPSSARITVLDAGGNVHQRTFVLLAGTQLRLHEAGLWEQIAPATHALRSMRATYRGQFGLLQLAGEDCGLDALGYAAREDDLRIALRRALAHRDNIELRTAAVTSCDPDGTVTWHENGVDNTDRFDAVGVAGLPQNVLEQAGFAFTSKSYPHQVLVTNLDAEQPSHAAAERVLSRAAITLIPHQRGWCHIATLTTAAAEPLLALEDEAYLQHLQEASWLHPGAGAAIAARQAYQPRLRQARTGGRGAVALLGASACSVHPIGAQELNLGVRDVLAWTQLLAGLNPQQLGNAGTVHARMRADDRRRIARLTDVLARALEWNMPGKLNAAGCAATAIDINPWARRWLLRRALALP